MIYILIVIAGIVGGYVLGLLTKDQLQAKIVEIKEKIREKIK